MGKRKRKNGRKSITRRKVLGGALGTFGTAMITGVGQKVPDAVIAVVKGLAGTTTVVTSTAVSAIVATRMVVNAAPQTYVPLHPDDERAGP